MNHTASEITIRPSSQQFWAENLGAVLLCFLIAALTALLVLSDSPYGLYASACEIVLMGRLALRYFSLMSYHWIIGNETLYQRCGLLYTVIDHVEMYRIIDYQEHQSPLQRLLRIKTLVLVSTDKLNGLLVIKGISTKSNLMNVVRDRVERCKQNKRIYEVTNS